MHGSFAALPLVVPTTYHPQEQILSLALAYLPPVLVVHCLVSNLNLKLRWSFSSLKHNTWVSVTFKVQYDVDNAIIRLMTTT
jgi:hypothetical protein